MSSFNSHGAIRQQEVQARHYARQHISRMLAQEARRTAVIVSHLIGQIFDERGKVKPLDQLWNEIQNSPQLTPVKDQADRNVSDYPEFQGWVAGQRRRIEHAQKSRLAQALQPLDDRRRFAHTQGLPR